MWRVACLLLLLPHPWCVRDPNGFWHLTTGPASRYLGLSYARLRSYLLALASQGLLTDLRFTRGSAEFRLAGAPQEAGTGPRIDSEDRTCPQCGEPLDLDLKAGSACRRCLAGALLAISEDSTVD